MNFHLQSKRPKRSWGGKLLFTFLVFASLLFVANHFGNGAVAGVFRNSASAVLGASEALEVTTGYLQDSMAQKKALLKERDALKERIRGLELHALNNLILASENEELRKLLGADKSILNRGILARVLSHGGSYPYGTMLIALESSTAPSVGAVVFGEHNTVVGTVTEVSSEAVLVKLISAPGHETKVLLGSGETLTSAVVRGIGNGNMTAEIARDAEVFVGDPVVLQGKASALVGYIGSIETKPADALKTVRVRTPLNLETLRFVRVQ